MKALSKLNECDLFIVHQCDVEGCKENLVIDRSFDNSMEFCMAKERLGGVLNMIPFLDDPGQIRMGCIATPKLGSRSCEEHHGDHK